ncbi:MAG: amino acid permease [Bacteroidota bacterium]
MSAITETQPKPATLNRTLGLFTAWTLVVTQMVGSGVFKKVAPMTERLGSPMLVMLAWILAGLITLAGALTNAEVAGLISGAGGQYTYFRRIYGRAFGFFFGWTSFTVIQSATVAAVAYVFSMTVNMLYTLPRLPESVESIKFLIFTPFENSGVKIVTITLIAVLSAVNYLGVKNGGLISKLIASATITGIALIVLLGLSVGNGDLHNVTATAGTFDTNKWAGFGIISLMILAMRDAFWAYEGWNNLGYLGMEIKDPNKNIPRALVLGVGAVVLMYSSINFTYMYVLSADELINVAHTPNSIAAITAVQKFMGSGGLLFVQLLILVATFGSTNGAILTAARLYYTMACDKLFFKKAECIHEKHQTPGNSLVMQGIWASVLVLSGSFDQLTDMLVFAAFLYYGAMALGVFILRVRMPDVPRPVKAWGYPVVPALFIVFCLVLVVISLIETPKESLLGLCLILSGLPFYLYWKKESEGVALDS